MTVSTSLDLLLATYNSEKYLAELLESLLEQTHKDFVLLVSDDGSSDRTLKILEEFAPRFRHRPRIVSPDKRQGSASANFNHLLAQSTADYVMLVDHDDIWHQEKVARGLTAVEAAEAKLGKDTPALCHGDLEVVDAAGTKVRGSFWQMRQIDPRCSRRLKRSLIHASVVGCTTTLNRALVEAVLPIPEEAVMHDWWITLVASATGTVTFETAPQISYRIHGNNVSNPHEASAAKALMKGGRRAVMKQKVAIRARQAAVLAERLEATHPSAAALAKAFAEIPGKGFIERRWTLLRHRFLFPGVWRNLAMLVAV